MKAGGNCGANGGKGRVIETACLAGGHYDPWDHSLPRPDSWICRPSVGFAMTGWACLDGKNKSPYCMGIWTNRGSDAKYSPLRKELQCPLTEWLNPFKFILTLWRRYEI
jgi:hypothetical protein